MFQAENTIEFFQTTDLKKNKPLDYISMNAHVMDKDKISQPSTTELISQAYQDHNWSQN